MTPTVFWNTEKPHVLVHALDSHLYTAALGGLDDRLRVFVFCVERVRGAGWLDMRLLRIENYDAQRQLFSPAPGVPPVTVYDPAVHAGASHYCSFTWRARGKRLRAPCAACGGQCRIVSLYEAFGTPQNFMPCADFCLALASTGGEEARYGFDNIRSEPAL